MDNSFDILYKEVLTHEPTETDFYYINNLLDKDFDSIDEAITAAYLVGRLSKES